MAPDHPRKTRRFGTDRVVLEGDRLLVVSRADMEGWDVRRHRSSLIRFDERTWRVAKKTAGADKTIEYELVPWRPGDQDLTGPEIDYNPDYVAWRDHTADRGRRRSYMTALLRVVSPVAGLLPARTKARFEVTFGLDPVACTFHSVFAEFLVALGGFTLASIGMVSRAFPVGWFLVIAVVASVDAFVRWGRILGEERPPPGFYEWLFKRRASPHR